MSEYCTNCGHELPVIATQVDVSADWGITPEEWERLLEGHEDDDE